MKEQRKRFWRSGSSSGITAQGLTECATNVRFSDPNAEVVALTVGSIARNAIVTKGNTVMAILIYEKAYGWSRCTRCNKIYPEELFRYFNDCEYQPKFNFCPNCGERIEPNPIEVKHGKE